MGLSATVLGAAGIGAAGSIIGGSEAASGAQAGADAELQMYNTTRNDLMPYNQGGQSDFAAYNKLITGSPAQQMAALEGLPGYQFTKYQGLKSVQQSAAARGLGVSGAALKGAAQYATGLADTTFGEQANRLLSGATLGENAGAQTGSTAGALGGGIAGALTAAGNNLGSGIARGANALGGATLYNALNGYGMYSAPAGFSGSGDISDLAGLY